MRVRFVALGGHVHHRNFDVPDLPPSKAFIAELQDGARRTLLMAGHIEVVPNRSSRQVEVWTDGLKAGLLIQVAEPAPDSQLYRRLLQSLDGRGQ